MALVSVTNKNNTAWFTDKYGGQVYEFPCGETVKIPEEAAVHIWGWGLDEKGRFKKRLRMGLGNVKDGEKVWNNVVLKAASRVEPTGVERDAA